MASGGGARRLRGLAQAKRERSHRDAAATGESPLAGLHWVAAGLFVAAGAEAVVAHRRSRGQSRSAWGWAPLIAAPLAGAAHAAYAMRPSALTKTAMQVLNGVVIGIGAAGVAGATMESLRKGDLAPGWQFGRKRPLADRIPSLAPITFGATGILGVILNQEEESEVAERKRLERRASLVERLTPRRRMKVDKLIVRV